MNSYVYCVVNYSTGSIPVIIGNRIFSTWAKADEYRKVLVENYPYNEAYYHVESIEVE